MGKTQSKRSVDITTDPKKIGDGVVTRKLEKIEDIDQKKELNGYAGSHEKLDPEKKEPDESENNKDLTTEKIAENVEDQSDQNASETVAAVVKQEAAIESAAGAEEISPLSSTDDSAKKPKKEKVKKKWSLRNLSFSKKDKQKPAKTEEAAANNEAAAAAAVAQGGAAEAVAEKAVATEKVITKLQIALNYSFLLVIFMPLLFINRWTTYDINNIFDLTGHCCCCR